MEHLGTNKNGIVAEIKKVFDNKDSQVFSIVAMNTESIFESVIEKIHSLEEELGIINGDIMIQIKIDCT